MMGHTQGDNEIRRKAFTVYIRMFVLFFIFCLLMAFSEGCARRWSAKPRPWTSAEKAIAVASTVAAAWNYHEASGMLSRGGYEINPMYSKHPSDTDLLIGMGLTHVLTLWLAHELDVIRLPIFGDCELRIPILVGKTAVNTGLVVHDSHVGR